MQEDGKMFPSFFWRQMAILTLFFIWVILENVTLVTKLFPSAVFSWALFLVLHEQYKRFLLSFMLVTKIQEFLQNLFCKWLLKRSGFITFDTEHPNEETFKLQKYFIYVMPWESAHLTFHMLLEIQEFNTIYFCFQLPCSKATVVMASTYVKNSVRYDNGLESM